MASKGRELTEWVTFNEYMCKLIGRVGAPTAMEIVRTWIDTMGRWADTAQIDGDD